MRAKWLPTCLDTSKTLASRGLYREQFTRAGALTRAFERFDAMLRERGYLTMGGQIVDATVIDARRPRLARTEKHT